MNDRLDRAIQKVLEWFATFPRTLKIQDEQWKPIAQELAAAASSSHEPARKEGWISVKDRLPSKDGTWFLCAHKYVTEWVYTQVRYGSYHPNAKGKECFRDISGHKVNAFLYWQPLSEPPKE